MGFLPALEKAAGGHLPGPRGGFKPVSTPTRVTPTTRPGNPVHGLRGLTGAPAMLPFGAPLRRFGSTSRPAALPAKKGPHTTLAPPQGSSG